MILTLALGIVLAAPTQSPSSLRPGQGRSAQSTALQGNGSGDLFANSSMSSTGHATRFKHYTSVQAGQGASAGTATGTSGVASHPTISPYINLLRGGNLALNYYDLQRDQQIYSTAAQTQQIGNQLRQATETRPMRQTTQPFLQNNDTTPTPLQRRFQPQDGAGTAGSNTGSNSEQIAILRDILRELKALRENSTPPARSEPKEQDQ